MGMTKTQAMLLQTIIEAAIMRAVRSINEKTDEEIAEMLADQKKRNAELMEKIEGH
jgi:hypothetical protein